MTYQQMFNKLYAENYISFLIISNMFEKKMFFFSTIASLNDVRFKNT